MLRVAEGDLDAFNKIVCRHQYTAWRVAYRFLGDAAEAEDITQEAFLRILDASHRYKPSAAFSTYLYCIVTRLCIDNKRKKSPAYTNTLPEIVDPSADPATALIQKKRAVLIRKSLDTLPARQRMVVILKYYEGLSYGEIAQAMGTTIKAVEGLLGRVRKTLQKHLSDIRE